jgi:hypothetical protein
METLNSNEQNKRQFLNFLKYIIWFTYFIYTRIYITVCYVSKVIISQTCVTALLLSTSPHSLICINYWEHKYYASSIIHNKFISRACQFLWILLVPYISPTTRIVIVSTEVMNTVQLYQFHYWTLYLQEIYLWVNAETQNLHKLLLTNKKYKIYQSTNLQYFLQSEKDRENCEKRAADSYVVKNRQYMSIVKHIRITIHVQAINIQVSKLQTKQNKGNSANSVFP